MPWGAGGASLGSDSGLGLERICLAAWSYGVLGAQNYAAENGTGQNRTTQRRTIKTTIKNQHKKLRKKPPKKTR
jgi:hypothetical protein